MLLRERWKLPKGKIDNLTKVIEDNGIIIVPFDFGIDKVDGISLYTERNHPVIFVNNNMSPDRYRLTVAHELGHLILHFGLPIADERNVEDEAFKFASEFLVPAKEFKSTIDSFDIKSLANMKLYWKVSMASLIVKAKQLEIITANQYKYMYAQYSALGFKTQEPPQLSPPKETPLLIKEIIQMYKDELGYTIEDLTGILNLYEKDFYNYFLYDFNKMRVVRS